MNEDTFDALFGGEAIRRGDLLLFRPEHAVRIVQALRDTGTRILGIDGFRELPQGIQPSMEQSADYTAGPQAAPASESWALAEAFIIERLDSGLIFEIVVE